MGQYELLRKIGSGGMAEVWMGRRPAMGGASKAVAIKLLARHIVDDPGYRQMFIEEARLSMLLTNSNVVQVFDVGEADGECFMVMEWVDGMNLAELTRKLIGQGERIATEVAAHVIAEVLRGLAYAHGLHHDGSQATIVHRDVSPQNVLCSVSGEVKLADFGVARLAREETSGLHVKGKLRYMAPEQLRGRSREPTVDLYAVGAMLHELLAGEKFRNTRDESELYSLALSGEYPPLRPSVPPELVHVCQRLLEPDPALRIQTADEALELLYRWPGYRNSTIDLGKLVREHSGVAGPRSGIVHFPASPPSSNPASSGTLASAATGPALASQINSVEQTAVVGDPTVQTGAPTEIVPMLGSGPLSGPLSGALAGPASESAATAQTRTWAGSGSSPEIEPTRVESPPPLSPSNRVGVLLLGLAAVIAVGFGVFGLGVGLGWWGPSRGMDPQASQPANSSPREQADPPIDAAASPSSPPEAEKPTEPVEAKTQASESVSTPEQAVPEVGPDQVGEGELPTDPSTSTTGEPNGGEIEAGASESGKPKPSSTRPRSDADKTPASVELVAHQFLFVYVKIGSQERALEPIAKLELKPGRHRVQLRESPDDAWKDAGTIKLEAGKRYKVRMIKPAGVKLEEL